MLSRLSPVILLINASLLSSGCDIVRQDRASELSGSQDDPNPDQVCLDWLGIDDDDPRSTVCTAPCCADGGGCNNVDPYHDGCILSSSYAGEDLDTAEGYVVGADILEDTNGQQVGWVELRYSCRCQAYWTETAKLDFTPGWQSWSFEVGASFTSLEEPVPCEDLLDDGVWGNFVQTDQITYGCGLSSGVIYNNTMVDNGNGVGGCGWISLKSSADPDPYRFDDVEKVSSCVDASCAGNSPPNCSMPTANLGVLYTLDEHPLQQICIDGVFDVNEPKENLKVEYAIISSQADNSTGDGDTEPDYEIREGDDPFCNAWVRAERQGNQDQGQGQGQGNPQEDRTYTINFRVTDSCGATCENSVEVTVCHDHGGCG